MTTTFAPDPIDVFVGAKMRSRRLMLGISQSGLAAPLGITFQQIQKYERGTNRVSASMLVYAARVLQCSPGWFFEDLPNAPVDDPKAAAEEVEQRRWISSKIGAAWVAVGRTLPAHAVDPLMRVAGAVANPQMAERAA